MTVAFPSLTDMKQTEEDLLRTIAELQKKQMLLQERLAEQDDFFANATLGFHSVNSSGTILCANHAELELLGYSSEEYIGRTFTDFYVDTHRAFELLRRLKEGKNVSNYPARLRCKDGTVKHVLIDSNGYWREGKFVHSRCFTRDVTELRNAELQVQTYAKLEAAARTEAESERKRLYDFLSIAPHELETSLTSLKLQLDLMKSHLFQKSEKTLAVEQLQNRLQSAVIQADRISIFVNNLFDLSRIDSGHLQLNHEN